MMSSASSRCLITSVRLARNVAEEAANESRPTKFDVLLEGTRIQRVSPAATRTESRGHDLEVVNGDGCWLLAGWIDVQINDLDFLSRTEHSNVSTEEHVGRIEDVLDYQASLGVTGVCLATVAAPLDKLEAYLKAIALVRHKPHPASNTQAKEVCLSRGRSALYGAVVEGTFMNPACHGCHNPAYIQPPSRPVLRQLLATGGVRAINIAPEMGDEEETLAVIQEASSSGVLVAVGHAKPHAKALRTAVESGCSYVIHLGNGPTGSSLKGECDGGMLEESLRNDDLAVTVIVDRRHIHPALIRDWLVRKQLRRMIAVSDCGFALGVPSAEFEAFGRRGCLSDDKTCLLQADVNCDASASRSSDNILGLFGSCATMKDIFTNLINIFTQEMEGVYYRHHDAWSLDEAVFVASTMCSLNPARLLGIDDQCGDVSEGKEANLVLVRINTKTEPPPPKRCQKHTPPPDVYSVVVERVWC